MTVQGNRRDVPRPKRGGIPSVLPNKEGADLSAGQCCPSGDVPSHAYPRPIDKGEARPGDRRRKHLPKGRVAEWKFCSALLCQTQEARFELRKAQNPLSYVEMGTAKSAPA